MRFILTIDIAPIIKYTCLYTFYERSFHIMANDDKSNGKIKSFLKSRWGELAVLGVLSEIGRASCRERVYPLV